MLPLLALTLAMQQESPPPFTPEDLQKLGTVLGLELSESERRLMAEKVEENRKSYQRMQEIALDNALAPAFVFTPVLPGMELRAVEPPAAELVLPEVTRPAELEQLAYADLLTLASLIRSRQVSCVELAQMYLARLKRLDQQLRCVVSYTEERALEQARALDAELAAGQWRGVLHGVPYGAKDLLSVPGYPTTWGAEPYQDQVLGVEAAVIDLLDRAGAVLIAKLSLGALAMGDVWFGGQTRNPWRLDQGSSGSSAGSAAAAAAGGVAFAIGSETLGSILSPSARCGCSSLRPSFGRVSRHGAMALSWTMDKLGPLCRSLDDAAWVFQAIQGRDPRDPTTVSRPFAWPVQAAVQGWRVGYLEGEAAGGAEMQRVLEELRALELELVPVRLPDFPAGDLLIILHAEAATAFDELTRSGRDDLLERQGADAWPNLFRAARLIPAVEYLRASRLRSRLILEMDRVMAQVDVLVHAPFAGNSLAITNLTGHPSVIAPCGWREDGRPRSVVFTGQLYDEARLLALAGAWQRSTAHHVKHPQF